MPAVKGVSVAVALAPMLLSLASPPVAVEAAVPGVDVWANAGEAPEVSVEAGVRGRVP